MADWIAAHASSPWLVFFGLIALSFILEDVATLSGAALVAEGVSPWPVALSAVLVGIVIGDLGLYGAGWLARSNRRLRNWLARKGVFETRGWFRGNLFWLVLLARFTPGLRLPTYSACGLVGVSFLRFGAYAIVMVVCWTVLLFGLTVGLADFAERYLALKDSWYIVIPFMLMVLLLGQRALRRRLAAANKAAGSATKSPQ